MGADLLRALCSFFLFCGFSAWASGFNSHWGILHRFDLVASTYALFACVSCINRSGTALSIDDLLDVASAARSAHSLIEDPRILHLCWLCVKKKKKKKKKYSVDTTA